MDTAWHQPAFGKQEVGGGEWSNPRGVSSHGGPGFGGSQGNKQTATLLTPLLEEDWNWSSGSAFSICYWQTAVFSILCLFMSPSWKPLTREHSHPQCSLSLIKISSVKDQFWTVPLLRKIQNTTNSGQSHKSFQTLAVTVILESSLVLSLWKGCSC